MLFAFFRKIRYASSPKPPRPTLPIPSPDDPLYDQFCWIKPEHHGCSGEFAEAANVMDWVVTVARDLPTLAPFHGTEAGQTAMQRLRAAIALYQDPDFPESARRLHPHYLDTLENVVEDGLDLLAQFDGASTP